MNTKIILLLTFFFACMSFSFGQKNKIEKDTIQNSSVKRESTPNMMLNASSDNGPRQINIGLPLGTYGATITEDGLLASYDLNGQMATKLWRQDGSFQRVGGLSLTKTAILYGDVSIAADSKTNDGTETLQGKVGFTTNTFGLLRGNVSVSGPLQNNWYYAVNAYLNMDPGTVRSDINRYLDQTQRYKAVLAKKYGESNKVGLRFRYIDSKSVQNRQTPYIYRSNGKVDALPGLDIGKVAYGDKYKTVTIINPLTGKEEVLDKLDDTGSNTYSLDIFGKNALDNKLTLDYILRYDYAKSGFYNTNNNKILTTDDLGANSRLIYTDNNNEQVYTGYYQNVMGIASPKTKYQTLQSRIELGREGVHHKWTLGLNAQYYNVDKAMRSTYSYLQEVANNPRILVRQNYNGTEWVNANNANNDGLWNMNGSFQYYDGSEIKAAIYAIDSWNITEKLNAEISTRLELHSIDGNWCPSEKRNTSPDNTWVSGETEDVSKSWFNKNFSLNLTYKLNSKFGFTAEANYFELGGNLSSYSGADDPQIKQSRIPYFSGGIYFNNPYVSLVSKVSHIQRDNINLNTNFSNDAGQSMKKTINYGVKTLGWTTDAIIKPFKGFQLHLLLTLQNPKYENFVFDVYGQEYNFNDNSVRSVSKTIIEIDPSYSWNKFRVWASARYFSKEQANFPNTLIFAGRWETFAGFDYRYNKNINFSVNAVNLLNQSGAQGNIAGSHTIMDGTSYYDKPLTGTYIRPFTIEFKTNIKF